MASAPEYDDRDKVVQCLLDVKTALQSIAEIENRIVIVDGADDALDQLKAATFPAAAILYDGMRGSSGGAASNRPGSSAHMVVSIMFLMTGTSLIKSDTKLRLLRLLTEFRKHMLGRRSPSGHMWEFLVEAPAETRKGMYIWVQRWQCPLQLQYAR